MQQTLQRVTCDNCGIVETFEILLVHNNGPIVATTEPASMLERRGWTAMRSGLRQVDLCSQCVQGKEK